MDIKVWDNHHKIWLEPMSIYFGEKGMITRVSACIPGAKPLKDGYWTFEGHELESIAIIGYITYNKHLIV